VAALSELSVVIWEVSRCGVGLSDIGDSTATSGIKMLPGARTWPEFAGDERREDSEATIDPGPFRWRGSGSAGFEAK
jgi:hypothetical protein